MHDPLLVLSVAAFLIFSVLLGLLVMLLILWYRGQKTALQLVSSRSRDQEKLTRKSHRQEMTLMETLLRAQMQENQSLRNQLRAPSVPDLVNLQYATLPSNTNASNEQGSNPVELGESLMWEEQLAAEGYTQGDLGGLESAGWASPVIRNDSSGDPVAFDVTGT